MTKNNENFWDDVIEKKVSKKTTPKKIIKQSIEEPIITKVEEQIEESVITKVEEPIITKVEEPIVIKKIIVEQPKTFKEIYEEYVNDNIPYKIYLRGQIIFDSVKHKDKPIFYENHFILFKNKYIYKGIRFEKQQ